MGKLRLTADEFAEKVNKAFNGRISIVKESYTGSRNKVTAYCNVHKIYFEVPRAYDLSRKEVNCPECSKDAAKKKVIKKWKEIHQKFIDKYGNKFSYDSTTYKGNKELMKVHCNDCGEDFEITPEHHLKYNNGGCPNCHKFVNAKCFKCGKNIVVDRRQHNHKLYCKECQRIVKLLSVQRCHKLNIKKTNEEYYIKCQFCGEYYKSGEHCKHQLCNEHQSTKWYQNLIPFGFDYSKMGTIEYMDEYYKSICVILIEYYDNMLSPKQIYEKYNCSEYNINSDVTIKNIIVNAGFKVRNRSEAVQNAIQTNTLNIDNLLPNPYKTERHTSWDGKIFLLRSSYETDFANILDEQQTPYEVEALRIRYFDTQQQKERIAIPDFLLTESNTIIEVKSSWTFDKQNMLDKRDAYIALGYEFKLWYEHEFVDLDTM